MSMPDNSKAKNVTVDRALRVLEAFLPKHGDLTLADLSKALKLDKSVIHRILATLVRRRFLEQDPVTKGYRVGLRMWEIGQHYVTGSPLEERAGEAIAEVVSSHPYATGYFATLDRDQTVVIRTVRGPGPINIHIDPGTRLPAGVTATGKALLAQLPPDELDELRETLNRQRVDRPRAAAKTSLDEDLKLIAKQGYAVNRGEFFPGIGTVAMAIQDASGRPVAALSVDFPITSETQSLWSELPKELREAVDELEALVRVLPGDPDL